jgi:hypothetical protein
VCGEGCEGLPLGAPELVLISALAAGADQMVASAALGQKWRLESVLPFARDDYANDFSGAELTEFRALLERSSSVLELDGKRGGGEIESRAYEAAGLVMLANSDIVIAIWDQQPAQGRGGTALIVNSAIEEGIPVVLLDPAAAQAPNLIWTGFLDLPPGRPRIEEMERRDALSNMTDVVKSLILPPLEPEERRKLRIYLAEAEKRFLIALLLRAFSDRKLSYTADVRPNPSLPKTRGEWSDYLCKLPSLGRLGEAISGTLLPWYAYSDKLAVIYAQLYRSAFMLNYLFASVAVTLALLGVFHELKASKPCFVALELALILLISWRTWTAHSSQWHRRWLEYRRLAEELRHLRMLAPVAGANRFSRPPFLEHNRGSWISWLLMINSRALPLPHVAIDQHYLRKLAQAVDVGELAGQIRYNKRTQARMRKVEAWLHRLGLLCFLATAFVCCCFLLHHWGFLPINLEQSTVEEWTTFLTALLPTLGAALNAVRVQGDFAALSRRAKRTLSQLERIAGIIREQAKQGAMPPLTLARLADHIDKGADAMSSDLDEWQILSTTKPVSLPS